jgi:hypothetical protein
MFSFSVATGRDDFLTRLSLARKFIELPNNLVKPGERRDACPGNDV